MMPKTTLRFCGAARAALALVVAVLACLLCAQPASAAQSVTDRYSDVNPDGWYVSDVQWVCDAGIMGGYAGTGRFGVGDELTRAQLAKIMAKASGVGDADLASKADTTGKDDLKAGGEWYTGSCNWAVENGIINGYAGTNDFGPNDPVTREMAAAIICRWAAGQGVDVSAEGSQASSLPDWAYVSDWAKPSVAWANIAGVVGGADHPDGTKWIEPSRNVLREEVCKMIHKATIAVEESEGVETRSFAVLSSDGVLSFYKREIAGIPEAGETFDGRTVAASYPVDEDASDMFEFSWGDDAADVRSVTVEDTISPRCTAWWFNGMRGCASMDLSKLDTSRVSTMRGMFQSCQSLTTVVGAEDWDTSAVDDMFGMFLGCSKLRLDCSGWDVAGVESHDYFDTNAPGVTAPAWTEPLELLCA